MLNHRYLDGELNLFDYGVVLRVQYGGREESRGLACGWIARACRESRQKAEKISGARTLARGNMRFFRVLPVKSGIAVD